MAFIFRRKRFKFLVSFEVEDLSLTPFVNGMLFAKMRLMGGGSFEEFTTREEVCEHRVQWQKKCQFECRIHANNNTGELESCICRVSVRKECKGGKSYQKLGFADVNLSEFAGAGQISRRYLLEGYSSKTRLDNSLLLVNVCMKLLSGDPVFKAPKPSIVELPGLTSHDLELDPENKGAMSGSEDSVTSGSSGFGSLTRNKKDEHAAEKASRSKKTPSVVSSNEEKDSFDPSGADQSQLSPSVSVQGQGHMRNNSSTSSMSKVSGYHSLGGGLAIGHSRQGSSDSGGPMNMHKRSRSVDVSEAGRTNSLGTRQIIEPAGSIEHRLGSTRMDPEEFIEDLLKNTNLTPEEGSEKEGLQLYVAADGSTAFNTQQLRHKSGKLERVIMDR